MLKHAWALLALPVVAACSSGPRDEGPAYRAPVYEEAKSGGPEIKYGVERTGLEFQIDRGTRVGDELLGGKVVVRRVTADSSLGALQADFMVKSTTADPVYALYRVIFYDDTDTPVGSHFSEWKPLGIDAPFGTATLHETCSQRGAVYFVLESWSKGVAKAKEKAAEKK